MTITRRQFIPAIAISGLAGAAAYYGIPGFRELLGQGGKGGLSTLMEPGPLGEKIIGDPQAPVTIIEYASMTCPHCRTFHMNELPIIKEKYVDTGMAKIYFREFPFDNAATSAFMLAQCAGEDKYFSMIDILFERQAVWSRSPQILQELFKIAQLAGFTQESFNTCLNDQELLGKVLEIQKKAANDYEVNATPTFFINGTKYAGSMSADAMGAAIEALL